MAMAGVHSPPMVGRHHSQRSLSPNPRQRLHGRCRMCDRRDGIDL